MLSNLIHTLFRTEDIKHISIEDLSHLVERYPYASVLYLLYVKRKYYTGEVYEGKKSVWEDHKTQELEKLYLLYDDPFWINFLLNENQSNIIPEMPELSSPIIEPSVSLVNIPTELENLPSTTEEEQPIILETPVPNKLRSIKEITKDMLPSLLATPIKKTNAQLYKKNSPIVPVIKPLKKDVSSKIKIQSKKESPQKRAKKITSITKEIKVVKPVVKKEKKLEKTLKTQKQTRTLKSSVIETKKKSGTLTASKKPMKGRNRSIQKSPTTETKNAVKDLKYWLKNSKKVSGSIGLNYSGETPDELGIYTQTMATLYENQGQLAKALEVYEHLLVENPSKKAFFAKKINRLKKLL